MLVCCVFGMSQNPCVQFHAVALCLAILNTRMHLCELFLSGLLSVNVIWRGVLSLVAAEFQA